jgi:hypothetical protein
MTGNIPAFDSGELRRFADLVIADAALADALSQVEEIDRFVELAMVSAGAHGIAISADALRAATRPDPLGISRWLAPLAQGPSWPPVQWLPTQVVANEGRLFVDWAHFGTRPLTDPFFEGSIRGNLRRPFNRAFRYRTTFADFLAGAEIAQSLAPSGFIFHMSRCGSTLVSQMLAAPPHNVAISEAASIDAVVQLNRAGPDLPGDQHAQALAAMVAAYGRWRAGNERHYVIKLDSWHTLALPLFARAFPSTPWVFLYRDPVEVLVSQMREPGTQMVAEMVPPSLYGIDTVAGVSREEYRARVLGKICGAVVDRFGAGGGLLVNYRELPEALFTRILPHFGIDCDESERAAMRAVAQYDAKVPGIEFAADTAAKQRNATDRLRTLADLHLGGVYRELEALRARQRP